MDSDEEIIDDRENVDQVGEGSPFKTVKSVLKILLPLITELERRVGDRIKLERPLRQQFLRIRDCLGMLRIYEQEPEDIRPHNKFNLNLCKRDLTRICMNIRACRTMNASLPSPEAVPPRQPLQKNLKDTLIVTKYRMRFAYDHLKVWLKYDKHFHRADQPRMHRVVAEGNVEEFFSLLGTFPVDIPNTVEGTILHSIVFGRELVLLDYVLAHAFELNVDIDDTDKRWNSPMMMACMFNNTDFLRNLVLAGALTDTQNGKLHTALMVEVSRENKPGIRLLRRGRADNAIQDSLETTALELAAKIYTDPNVLFFVQEIHP